MFSVLVTADTTAWETDQRMSMTASRFYKAGDESAKIDLNDPSTLGVLEMTPALLMYEDVTIDPRAGDVRFGLVHSVRKTDRDLTFLFKDVGRIPRATVNEFTKRLGMNLFDHSHTHWAVRDGAIPSQLLQQVKPTPEKYDVVLSFAGENREYVAEVAELLVAEKVRVFYDEYESVNLWGKDLAEHFDSVYRNDGQYCVMFISQAYADKMWTRHERRSALARGLESVREYILPARFDDAKIDGLRPSVHFVDLRKLSPAQLTEVILKKLGRREPGARP